MRSAGRERERHFPHKLHPNSYPITPTTHPSHRDFRITLHPSKDPGSSLTSQRRKQKEVAPLVSLFLYLAPKRRWEGPAVLELLVPMSESPFKYLLKLYDFPVNSCIYSTS
jgi:hypothetical protein